MNRTKGFTLIELVIVVAIIGIIAAIAFPSYQDSVRKSRRADCQAQIMAVAQAQERHFTRFNQYAANLQGVPSPTNLGWSGPGVGVGGGAAAGNNPAACNITIQAPNNGATYTLTGTPLIADNDCGNLTLTNLGIKGENGSRDVDFCW